MPSGGFSRRELRILRQLNTPEKVARFLDEKIAYNKETGGITCHSARTALREGVAHCVEGAILACAALELQGNPPLIWDLEAVRDDDHVLAVYKENGCWGSLAKSNYSGLRHRAPVYRTLRELAMSYFEHYYNPRGEKTLRGYGARPVSLTRFDSKVDWRASDDNVWEIPEYLCDIAHRPVLLNGSGERRYRMDRRLYEAGFVGSIK
jgi:hypothetical protein